MTACCRRCFAKTSRHDTPWVGNLMVAVGGIGLIILAETAGYNKQFGGIFGTDEFATFITAATVGSFMVEVVYVHARRRSRSSSSGSRAAPGIWWKTVVLLVGDRDADPRLQGRALARSPQLLNYNWVALYWSIGMLRRRRGLARHLPGAAPEPGARAARHAAEDRGSGVPVEDPLRY